MAFVHANPPTCGDASNDARSDKKIVPKKPEANWLQEGLARTGSQEQPVNIAVVANSPPQFSLEKEIRTQNITSSSSLAHTTRLDKRGRVGNTEASAGAARCHHIATGAWGAQLRMKLKM